MGTFEELSSNKCAWNNTFPTCLINYVSSESVFNHSVFSLRRKKKKEKGKKSDAAEKKILCTVELSGGWGVGGY